MNKASHHKMYNKTQVATSNPGTLLLMLYGGAIQFLKKAREAINAKDLEASNNNIIRAEAIIVELMTSLNMEVGGEISRNLYSIYDYLYHTLVEANTQKDGQKVDGVIRMLESMKRTWEEVIKKESQNDSNVTKEKASSLNIAI